MAKSVDVEAMPSVDAEGRAGTAVAKRVDAAHPEQSPQAQLPSVSPAQLLQIAVEQGADIEKLGKLMDLQERYEKNEARKAYVEAMAEFKKEPPTIVKDHTAGFDHKQGGGRTEYKYASLDQVAAKIAAALALHGLSHDWKIDQPHNEPIQVTCIITHKQGHSESTVMKAGPDTSGTKNPIQSVASAISYLERYTLLAATGLAASNQDDDGADSGARISDEQKQLLVDKQREVYADTEKFLKFLDVKTLDDLPASKFDIADAALEDKRKENQRRAEA